MLTCIIRYHIAPTKNEEFAKYTRNWAKAIPRCVSDPHGPTQ